MKPSEKRTAEALRMIREGHWTIRRAARFAGLRYLGMLDKMADAWVDSGPTVKELRDDRDRPEK